jgi:hypothetical protein
VRFWELRARGDSARPPLDVSERRELFSLVQLVTSDARTPAFPAPAVRRGLPVQLTAGSGFLSGQLQEVAADQVVVTAAESLVPGERTVVSLSDAVRGLEYTLPCTVIWSHDGTPCAMGLEVDGIPTRALLRLDVAGRLRSPLGTTSARASA